MLFMLSGDSDLNKKRIQRTMVSVDKYENVLAVRIYKRNTFKTQEKKYPYKIIILCLFLIVLFSLTSAVIESDKKDNSLVDFFFFQY